MWEQVPNFCGLVLDVLESTIGMGMIWDKICSTYGYHMALIWLMVFHCPHSVPLSEMRYKSVMPRTLPP